LDCDLVDAAGRQTLAGALVKIGHHVNDPAFDIGKANPQSLANIATPLGKGLDCGAVNAEGRQTLAGALVRIGQRVNDPGFDTLFNHFASPDDFQACGLLANALGKMIDDPTCLAAVRRLSDGIASGQCDLRVGSGLSLAQLLRGFGRLPAGAEYAAGRQRIVAHIQSQAERFSLAELKSLRSALATFPNDPVYRDALADVARAHTAEKLAQLSLAELGEILIAFGQMKEIEGCRAVCERAIVQIKIQREAIKTAELTTISKLLTGFRWADLPWQVADLGGDCIDRVKVLMQEDPGFFHISFEDLGHLCHSLTGLFRSPNYAQYKNEALDALLGVYQPASNDEDKEGPAVLSDGLLQIAQRKLTHHLRAAADAAHSPDNLAMRDPGYTGYLIMRSLHVSLSSLGDGTRRSTAANRIANRKRHAIMHSLRQYRDWVGEELANHPDGRSRYFIDWMENFEDPTRIRENALRKQANRLRKDAAPNHYEARFQSWWDMGTLQAYEGGPNECGLVPEIIVDHEGNFVESKEKVYLPIADLTGGEIPFLRMKLPKNVNTFTLNKTFSYKGIDYAFNVFAGNSAKEDQQKLATLLDGDDADGERGHGTVWAVPVRELAPGTAFSAFISKLFPNREQFYYGHRALFPHGPDLPKLAADDDPKEKPFHLASADHVLAGRLRVAYIPDAEEICPFKMYRNGIQTPENQIQLRTYDGHGFIKDSELVKMPAYRKLLDLLADADERMAKGEDVARDFVYGSKESGRVPAQLLRYYRTKPEVIAEAMREMARQLDEFEREHPGRPLPPDLVHRFLTAGNLHMQASIAIPSNDDNLRLSALKSVSVDQYPEWNGEGEAPETPDASYPVLMFRSPATNQAVRAFDAEQVKTPWGDDLTARYLTKLSTMQHTLLSQTRRLTEADGTTIELDKKDWFYSFHKGLLTPIPDADWPEAFADVAVAMPSGDRKTHTHARGIKIEDPEVTRAEMAAVLVAAELYPANSLVAVPPAVQTRCGGDFDGDALSIKTLVRKICTAQEYARRAAVANAAAAAGKAGAAPVRRVKEIIYPELFAYMRYCDKEDPAQQNRLSQKPPKQLTAAFTQYQGLSLETADKMTEWLKGVKTGQSDTELYHDIVDALTLECNVIMEMQKAKLPYQLVGLQASLLDWQHDVANRAAIVARIRTQLAAYDAAVAEETGDNATLDMVDTWLAQPAETTVANLCHTLEELRKKTGFDTDVNTYRHMLDLRKALLLKCDLNVPEAAREHAKKIEAKLDVTPIGGDELYDITRTPEFMSTRQGLMQGFDKVADIYWHVHSDHRPRVARELVHTLYEGISADTANEIRNFLYGNVDLEDAAERSRRFNAVVSTLQSQSTDVDTPPAIRQKVEALLTAFQDWHACKSKPEAERYVPAPKDADDSDSPAMVDALPLRKEAVWTQLNEMPQQLLPIPDTYPKKPAVPDNEENAPVWDGYYQKIAELTVELGSYIGYDIYKTAGEIAKSWRTVQKRLLSALSRMAKDPEYGVEMNVPCNKRQVAKIVRYGGDSEGLKKRLESHDDLASGFMRGSTQLLRERFPAVFDGVNPGVGPNGWVIPLPAAVGEALQQRIDGEVKKQQPTPYGIVAAFTELQKRTAATGIAMPAGDPLLTPQALMEKLTALVSDKQFTYVNPSVPGLIEVALVYGAGKQTWRFHLQCDKTGQIVRAFEAPGNRLDLEKQLDERHGPVMQARYLKKHEKDKRGIVIENPTTQTISVKNPIHFEPDKLKAIVEGRILLKWGRDAWGRLRVVEEVPVDKEGNRLDDDPSIKRRFGHPNIFLGMGARISGRIRVEYQDGCLTLLIDNHSTRHSTDPSRKPEHLDNAKQSFIAAGLGALDWASVIKGDRVEVKTHWFELREDGKGFVEGAYRKLAVDTATQQKIKEIKTWADFEKRLAAEPPSLNFPQVAAFFLWQSNELHKPAPNRYLKPQNHNWIHRLQTVLPGMIATAPQGKIDSVAINQWSRCFDLLRNAGEAADSIQSLLQQTAGLITRYSIDERAMGSIGYNLHALPAGNAIDDGIAQVRQALTAKMNGLLTQKPSVKGRPVVLLSPRSMARAIYGAEKSAGDDAASAALRSAVTGHATAQWRRLQASEPEAKKLLFTPDNIRLMILGLRNSAAADADALLKILHDHVTHSKQAGFAEMAAADLQLLTAETLAHLESHLNRPAAQNLVSALYRQLEILQDEMAPLAPPMSHLAENTTRAQAFYRLMAAAGQVEHDDEFTKVDLHGMSHHAAKKLVKLALAHVSGTLSIIYGKGQTDPANEGLMRQAVEEAFREAGWDPKLFYFGAGRVTIDRQDEIVTARPSHAGVAYAMNASFDDDDSQHEQALSAAKDLPVSKERVSISSQSDVMASPGHASAVLAPSFDAMAQQFSQRALFSDSDTGSEGGQSVSTASCDATARQLSELALFSDSDTGSEGGQSVPAAPHADDRPGASTSAPLSTRQEAFCHLLARMTGLDFESTAQKVPISAVLPDDQSITQAAITAGLAKLGSERKITTDAIDQSNFETTVDLRHRLRNSPGSHFLLTNLPEPECCALVQKNPQTNALNIIGGEKHGMDLVDYLKSFGEHKSALERILQDLRIISVAGIIRVVEPMVRRSEEVVSHGFVRQGRFGGR